VTLVTAAGTERRKGIALVVAAAVAWSTAAFFTRLLPFDSWTILFWRGLFGCGAIVTFMVLIQGRDKVKDLAATGPFVTAALAWFWLRETPRQRTIVASVVALCGIAIIVGGPRPASDMLGIALACLMTVAIAVMTVVIRRHKETPMVAAAALSNLLGSVVSIPFAGGIAAVAPADLVTFAMFGFFQVALGLTLFVLGARLLPSGQTALVGLLETPLMPFWIWLAFHEVPAPSAFAGGALVMGAVVADILGDLRT